MPNHLLQWNAIRWACEAGYRIYDFRGVSPVRDGVPTQAHLAGLNRFKEGFGARYLEYAGEFDLPLRRGWYGLWRGLAPTAMRVLARRRGAGADV
jgi:lipid II:glycine glycyltransferase (peptidoglycan interpeptide bridge formation enzyme)